MRLIPVPIIVAIGAALAACAPQPTACRGTAMGELQAIDQQIAETRGNIARGFVPSGSSGGGSGQMSFCVGGGGNNVGMSFCSGGNSVVRSGPVAVDPAAEQRKLDALLRQRQDIQRRADAEAAACAAARAATP